MKYGKIRDKLKGIIDWENWPHLIYLLDCLARYRFIVILKAKQIGITWLMSGANLHLATFQKGANILTLSKGEPEANESLDYSRFIHDNLPDFLRLSYGKNQESLLTFPHMQSKLRALPSTEDAGVGFGGATRVVMDEFEYHRYAKANFAEIYSALVAGGQLVVLSTADKTKINTDFKALYTASKLGDNNFFPIFFPYNVLAERTEDWYDSIDLPASQKECRFPRNEKEALETLKTGKFFSADALESMREDVTTPIQHELSDKYRTVRIYKLPVVGKRYCLFNDPSEGREDPHAMVMIDQTGEQVAESHGKTTADQCAQIHDALVRLYNNAFNGYESGPGGAGGIVANKLKDLATPNVCAAINVSIRPFKLDTKSGKKGWWTSRTLWDVIIQDLEEAVRLRQIVIRSRECIDELYNFIVPEGEDPRKPDGGHDDYIDAWCRVWQLKKFMPTGDMRVMSFDYRD